MRYLITCLVLLTALNSVGQQRGFRAVEVNIDNQNTTLYNQSHALIVGISDFTNGWPDLPGVEEDVMAVKGALESNGFNVEVTRNASKNQLDQAFTNFISKYGQNPNNRLLIYFAGHGHTVNTSYGDNLGYIVPADAPLPGSNFQSKAMAMAQIEIYAKQIQSKHALFLFDACFSGSLLNLSRAAPVSISYKTTQAVRQFITSGSENEEVPDKSIFRRQFVEALTTDHADANKDGYLTGSELGNFLQEQVINYSYNAQHPQYGKIRHPKLDKGDFVFVLNNNSNPSVNTNNNTPSKTPSIGVIETTVAYGKIIIDSEVGGDLYLDGSFLTKINPYTKVPINDVVTGYHDIEIKGSNPWQKSDYLGEGAVLTFKVNKPKPVVNNNSSSSRNTTFMTSRTWFLETVGADLQDQVIEFHSNGQLQGYYLKGGEMSKFASQTSAHSWKFDGNKLVIKMNNDFVTYEGTYNPSTKKFSGTAKNVKSKKWTWTMKER